MSHTRLQRVYEAFERVPKLMRKCWIVHPVCLFGGRFLRLQKHLTLLDRMSRQ